MWYLKNVNEEDACIIVQDTCNIYYAHEYLGMNVGLVQRHTEYMDVEDCAVMNTG